MIRSAKLTPAGWVAPPPPFMMTKFAPIAPRPIFVMPTPSPTLMQSPHQNISEKDSRERAFICTYENCSKTYLKSSHLKAHIRVHTGKIPKYSLSFTANILTYSLKGLTVFILTILIFIYCLCYVVLIREQGSDQLKK